MRVSIIAVTVAALFATSALAADVSAPLAPGKPAGLKQAQAHDDNTVLYIVGGGAVIAGIVLLASNGGGNNTVTGGGTTTTTTTTTGTSP